MRRVLLALLAGVAAAWIVVATAGRNPVTCHLNGSLPDRNCTPGVRSRFAAARVCRLGPRRGVPHDLVVGVYDVYGIGPRVRALYRPDELIPRQLGGGLRSRNIWPEPIHRLPGPAAKRSLERRLHQLVCSHRLSLRVAQNEISNDWVAAYRHVR
ncbi:MAG: hypothetical protein M3155_00105 [Actinomycetota bacterium]|nr:hypothetical protein [Actinomycetota bacterium]